MENTNIRQSWGWGRKRPLSCNGPVTAVGGNKESESERFEAVLCARSIYIVLLIGYEEAAEC